MTPRSQLKLVRDSEGPDTATTWHWKFMINGRIVARGRRGGYARRRFAMRSFRRMRDRILTGEYLLPTKVERR